jgi:leucyl aminopeptidase (aminopeptidase T)
LDSQQDGKMTSLEDVAKIVWKDCLAVKPAEKALIVSDSKSPKDPRFGISRILWDTGKNLCKDCALILMEKTGMHGREPGPEVAKAMLDFGVIVAPTEFSISHTKASINAANKGARVATMPGITEDMFLRAIPIDYRKMDLLIKKLEAGMQGDEFHVTTKAGTDMYLYRGKRKIWRLNGLIGKGEIKNLPDGEIAFAPLEGKSGGILVVDLSAPFIGIVKKPFRITLEKGHAVGCEEPKLWKAISSVENGTNLAEFGIGTNPRAKITGNILEDEKVLETAHIAFGTNAAMGGRVQTSIHLDSVFDKPTISVDGKGIIRNGGFLG